MKFPRIVSIFAGVLLAGAALSATAASLPAGMTAVPLATITNDRDASVSKIQLMVNKHSEVRGIYLKTLSDADGRPSEPNGQVYWLHGIESEDGVVLGQGQGVKAIFLRGNIQASGGHGLLVIRYLTNGIFGSFDECRVGLRRVAPHDWQLVNTYNHHPVDHIKVETWALGISTLANVCPGQAA